MSTTIGRGTGNKPYDVYDKTEAVSKAGIETITGQKTFTTPVIIPDAINVNEPLSKGQLLTAIKAVDGTGSGLDADLVRGLPADFTLNKATNGYQKLPSGLIIQWAYYSAGDNAHTYTFPIAFPTACLNVTANAADGANATQVVSFTATDWTGDISAGSSTKKGYYKAIGY